MGLQVYQWICVLASSVLLFVFSPKATSLNQFFKAWDKNNKKPSTTMLIGSLVISWIFAKSISNAADLGRDFGLLGGVAYAAYYVSFLVAGLIIYRMRTIGNYKSIPQFLSKKFGRTALLIFAVLICFRLFNEVWSNTMVIGSYFGAQGSTPYFLAIVIFTLLTLAYALKGGLSSSLLTDLIQFILFGVLLVAILSIIIPKEDTGISAFTSSISWEHQGAINLILVALLQVFSYPFHDPVLTDRAFILGPKKTRSSFIWATLIGFVCIVLFSFVGISARLNNLEGPATNAIANATGLVMTLLINLIMVTSAASTLDSAFSSFSKLVCVDVPKKKQPKLSHGRIAMISICVLGSIPVFFGPEILSATTISGTMVIGLAPIFLFWNKKVHKHTFSICVLTGIAIGIAYSLDILPRLFNTGTSKYADLLDANILGTISCFLVFGICALTPSKDA